MSIPTSDAAHAAWNRLYNTRKVKLDHSDPEPFRLDRWLGKGGFSEVYSTDLGNGTLVALKRINFRLRDRPFYVNEMKILEKLSAKPHRHIIELIGCYELPRGSNSQLGLLIWPVAQYDLARFLGFVDGVANLRFTFAYTGQGARDEPPRTLKPEEREAVEEVLDLTLPHWRRNNGSIQEVGLTLVESILKAALERLRTVFGCLAEAIAYLHDDQMIRYKDMKPSQILLSPHGLWLTDFGWSMDISELSNSATNNGDTISTRYHAPERASVGQYCGRPEDIFALGCTYLEMAYRLCYITNSADLLNPNRERRWSYQAKLDQKETWLGYLNSNRAALPNSLRMLISRMMDRDPTNRPLISEVVEILRRDVSRDEAYFAPCCTH